MRNPGAIVFPPAGEKLFKLGNECRDMRPGTQCEEEVRHVEMDASHSQHRLAQAFAYLAASASGYVKVWLEVLHFTFAAPLFGSHVVTMGARLHCKYLCA